MIGAGSLEPVRGIVAGVGIGQAPAGGVEDALENGDEHIITGVGQDALVGRSQNEIGPGLMFQGVGANEGAAQGHEQGGSQSLVGDISHEHAQTAVGQGKHIVKVARGLLTRVQRGGQLEALSLRQRVR